MKILAVVLVLLVVALVGFYLLRHRGGTNPEQAASSPVETTTATGSDAKTLSGHDKAISSLSFSSDSAQLASSSEDSTVRLWDPVAATLQQTLEEPGQTVSSVAYSPDSSLMAVGMSSGDKGASILIIERQGGKLGQVRNTISYPHDLVSTVGFSPDGKVVAASTTYHVGVWEAATAQSKQLLDTGANSVFAFAGDGKQVLSGSSNENEVKLWDLNTATVTKIYKGHARGPMSLAVSPDGQRVLSGGYDDKMLIWSLGTAELQQSIPLGDSYPARRVAFSADGTQVACACSNQVRMWQTGSGTPVRTIPVPGVQVIAFSPNGKWLAAGDEHGAIRLWPAGISSSQ